jgi:hypothetical protein
VTAESPDGEGGASFRFRTAGDLGDVAASVAGVGYLSVNALGFCSGGAPTSAVAIFMTCDVELIFCGLNCIMRSFIAFTLL